MTPRDIAIQAIVDVSGASLATMRGNAVIDALEAAGYVIIQQADLDRLEEYRDQVMSMDPPRDY